MPTEFADRFTGRAEPYARYRPRYSLEAVTWGMAQAGLRPGDVVADMGCGTGILTRHLLEAGLRVIGIEPNDDMRAQALEATPDLDLRAASAEDTGLEDGSVAAITAGQAIHWFDPVQIIPEWHRILRPGGRVLEFTNLRQKEEPGWMAGFEALFDAHHLRRKQVGHAQRVRGTDWFVDPVAEEFPHQMELDWEGVLGHCKSYSWFPLAPGEFEPALRALFEAHQVEGKITMLYRTRVVVGRVPLGDRGVRP